MNLSHFGGRVLFYGLILLLPIEVRLPAKTGDTPAEQAITVFVASSPEPVVIDAATYKTATLDTSFSFSSDGRTVYFARTTNGPYQIMKSECVDGVWKLGLNVDLGGLRSWPTISPDGQYLFF